MSKINEYFTSIRACSDYPSGKTDFIYEFARLPQLTDIFKPYHLSKIAGEGDTFTKARRIMQWVDDNTSYNGASPLGPALPDKIIDFGIRQKNPINCANRAILFCDALVSLEIFAFQIVLQHRPYLPKKKMLADECHCHVIAQVWLPEKRCWSAFDPSFNTYFTDHRGNPVSVPNMVKMERTWRKVRSIDNRSAQHTKRGSLCTRIGLFDICIFPGNDFTHRYRFEEQIHLLPESYAGILRNTGHTDDGWDDWNKHITNSPKMKITDLDSEPAWKC